MISKVSRLPNDSTLITFLINDSAIHVPVISQLLFALKVMSLTVTTLQIALVCNWTSRPVLFPLFISELLITAVAIEQLRVKLLFDESIDFIAKILIITAVWTLIASKLPLSYACGASQLITLQALFGVFDYLKANET